MYVNCGAPSMPGGYTANRLVRWLTRSKRRVQSDHPVLICVADGLRAVACPGLREDAVDVRLDGGVAQEQHPRNLGVRQPGSDQLEDLGSTRIELWRQAGSAAPRRVACYGVSRRLNPRLRVQTAGTKAADRRNPQGTSFHDLEAPRHSRPWACWRFYGCRDRAPRRCRDGPA